MGSAGASNMVSRAGLGSLASASLPGLGRLVGAFPALPCPCPALPGLVHGCLPLCQLAASARGLVASMPLLSDTPLPESSAKTLFLVLHTTTQNVIWRKSLIRKELGRLTREHARSPFYAEGEGKGLQGKFLVGLVLMFLCLCVRV